MSRQTLVCFLSFVLLVSLVVVVYGAQKKYEPQLVADRPYRLTLSKTKPISFFRLQVHRTNEIQAFEVLFSSCAGGKITTYSSACLTETANCDDGSDSWFPDEKTFQNKQYSTLGKAGQETLSFGRTMSNDKKVFFYGVALTDSSPDQATVQVVFRTAGTSNVQGKFLNSNSISVSKLNLAWKSPEYCEYGDPIDTTKCKKILSIAQPKYTIYIQKLSRDSPQENNMGCECGLLVAPQSVLKVPVSDTSVDLAKHVTSNGQYIVNVGIELPGKVNNGYYAYHPKILTIERSGPQEKNGNIPTLIKVCIALGLVGALLVGIGLIITAFCIYKGRRSAYESLPLVDKLIT